MNLLVACTLVCVFCWNMRTLDFARYGCYVPEQMNRAVRLLGLDQCWAMFAPRPPKVHGWLVVEGRARDGKVVDLAHGVGPVGWQKPKLLSSTFPDQRWRKYLERIPVSDVGHCSHYADYLWDEWDRKHGPAQKLQRLAIYFIRETTPPPNALPSPPEKLLLLERKGCPSSSERWGNGPS